MVASAAASAAATGAGAATAGETRASLGVVYLGRQALATTTKAPPGHHWRTGCFCRTGANPSGQHARKPQRRKHDQLPLRDHRRHGRGQAERPAKGVTYRVGQVRAHSLVVGTHLVAQDSGNVVVTDRRAVFMGTKKTLEFRRDRLVGLGQYADGLRLSVSNRQTASLFRFAQGSSPTIAAALLSRT